ncbi:hypothetical protein D3C84_1077620 [compost metagenome]
MPAQSIHDDVDRQQIVHALHVDLLRRQELQREQVERPAQQVRFGFGQQLVVHTTLGVAGVPDIGAGGRGVHGFKIRHGRSPKSLEEFLHSMPGISYL